MPNALRSASRTRLLILFIATLFGVSIFLQQMYFARPVQAVSSSIVISQIYGGGGNAGAPFRNDFIELFNRGTAPINLTGWSVQYTSATGTGLFSANTTALSGTLNPGQYYLVQEASNAAVGSFLPTPDASGGINMSATGGKVIVANTASGIACNGGSTPCTAGQLANIVDLIGYDGANFFEGAAPAPALSNTTANFRDDLGCTDTDNNGLDFASATPPVSPGTPAPRNTASPLHTCTGPPALSINDVSVAEGDSGTTTATFTVSLSSPAPVGGVTFDISTQNDSATTADNDYVAKTLTGQTIPFNSQTYSFDVTVNGDMNFESNETFFVNVTNVTGATVADGQGVGTITNDDCPPPAADIVISQVYGGGGNTGATYTNDFIELYNQGSTTVNLAGWSVQYASAAGTSWAVTPLTGSIAPNGYYLIQEASNAAVGSPLPTPDDFGTIAMAAGAGKVALSSSMTPFSGACPTCAVDLVGYGSTAGCFEGAGPTGNLSATTADLRKRRGCIDTNNNNADFTTGSPNPRNTASPLNSCVILSLAIHDIQGSGAASPYAGQEVMTSGVVTARKSNGFFLQEPDASVDADPTTSEGVFVFTSSAPTVAVGDAATINLGSVSEFFNLTEVNASSSDITVTSSGNSLPAPVVLTTSILDSAGTVAQMERFEGMRLHADSLTSVGPTNEFGEFFTVLTGVDRPFREEGVEASFTLPGGAPCCVPRFDENPERLMVDSDGQAGATSIAVTTGVTVTNVTGPLDFTFDDYKVLPDTPPSTTANAVATPVRLPTSEEFTVGSFNMERFLTATDVTNRLNKVSLAIRNVMRSPDIIGVEEVGDITLLDTIAAKVNADTVAGGDPDPGYVAYLEEGNDIGGIDVGFLVKSSTVTVNSVTQVGKNATFIDPNDNSVDLLNDRPPLFLRATVQPPAGAPFPVTVIVNHLRSLIDISDTGATGNRVRAKRRAQAEFIANEIQMIQATENVVSVGDYNAFQVNDGYVDVIGTIRGVPTGMNNVVLASPDLVTPDLTNLIGSAPADQQYSFVFGGNAQAIDHVLVDPEMLARNSGFAYARNNADFPEAFRGDMTRSERVSDHDMPVAYFSSPKADTTTTVSNATTVFSSTDQSVMLTANVTADALTVNEGTVTFTVTNAGNAVVGLPVMGNVSGGVATANYTLPGGTLPQALTITADFSGGDFTHPSSGTGTLSVTYGICLLYDPTKAVKSGATYPIKIQLCDINGGNLSSAGTVVTAVGVGLASTTTYGDVMDAGNANADFNFRFDSTLGGTGGYIYNLKTTGLTTGTYSLYFTAGSDPTLHTVQFQVK